MIFKRGHILMSVLDFNEIRVTCYKDDIYSYNIFKS